MNSKIKHMYDALLALRAIEDRTTAVVADGASTGLVDLHKLTAGRGDLKGLFGQTPFDVVIHVDEVDTTSGDEVYTLKLQTVDAAGANPTDVVGGSVTITSALVGEPVILKIDPANILLSDPDGRKLRIFADVTGVTPSIKFFAYAAPNSKA